MSVTVATRPIYPLVGDIWVSFTATAGDAVRVYMTAAPERSQAAQDVERAGGPVLVHEGDANRAWRWNADVPGVYVVRIDELDRGVTAYAGGWRGSPSRARSESVVSSQSVSLLVGQPLRQPLGWGKNRGTLVCHLFGNYLRALSVAINGEESPRLDGASTLMQTADVMAAVDALANQTSTAVLTGIATLATNYAAAFNAHLGRTSVHYTADTSNVLSTGYATVGNPAALGQMLARYQDSLRRHIQDYVEGATPALTGFGKGGYHHATTTEGLPQAPGASDAAGCLIALGDLIVAYDAHRVSIAAHSVADTNTITGTPPSLGTLDAVHYRVAKALRLGDSTLTSTEHAGIPSLVATGGFSK